jgi:hypothetical protein
LDGTSTLSPLTVAPADVLGTAAGGRVGVAVLLSDDEQALLSASTANAAQIVGHITRPVWNVTKRSLWRC